MSDLSTTTPDRVADALEFGTVTLPELPDADAVIAQALTAAHARIAHFEAVREEAEREIAAAREVIDRFSGGRRRAPMGSAEPKQVSAETYRSVLAAVASHGQGCYMSTIATSIGKGESTVANAIRILERDGMIRVERRRQGRKRAWVTPGGEEFLTNPEGAS